MWFTGRDIMEELYKAFEEFGIHIPEILLPCEGTNMTKWSVIACDQYTSEPKYWEKVRKLAGSSPSTLNLILPEIYLKEKDLDNRISKINSAMNAYLGREVLKSAGRCFIYVERQTRTGRTRKGIVAAIDLDRFDYSSKSESLFRPTEEIVEDRLPSRMKIRENASLECPHIMLLLDDPNKSVIEPLSINTDRYNRIYSFDLMQNGGHITGYSISDRQTLRSILAAFEKLVAPEFFTEKYGLNKGSSPLLLLVGDGNHSLASAKAHWENIKKTLPKDKITNHPAKYALVEIVNIHDDSLIFEPIHRMVTNINHTKLIEEMKKVPGYAHSIDVSYYDSRDDMKTQYEKLENNYKCHHIPFEAKEKCGILSVSMPVHDLPVGTLQTLLDSVSKNEKEIEIDYIHEDDTLSILSGNPGCTGFHLPPMDKHVLFKTIIQKGTLPRKTFSMGHAEEKRYYLECRRLVIPEDA
jgi:hypothetical protein